MGTAGNDLNGLHANRINGGGSSTSNDGSANDAYSGGWGDIVQDNIMIDIGGICASITHTSNQIIFTNNTMVNCARNGVLIANTTNGGLVDYSTFSNNIIVNSVGAFR